MSVLDFTANPQFVTTNFIETGTYRGETLAAALAVGFRKCYSIEVCPELHKAAFDRFFADPRAHVMWGSSPDVLPRIIDPSAATTFWLDAHYQGYGRDEMDAARGETPLLAELDAILAAEWKVPPLILIDDSQCFQPEAWRDGRLPNAAWFDPSQWPTEQQIRQKLDGFDVREVRTTPVQGFYLCTAK